MVQNSQKPLQGADGQYKPVLFTQIFVPTYTMLIANITTSSISTSIQFFPVFIFTEPSQSMKITKICTNSKFPLYGIQFLSHLTLTLWLCIHIQWIHVCTPPASPGQLITMLLHRSVTTFGYKSTNSFSVWKHTAQQVTACIGPVHDGEASVHYILKSCKHLYCQYCPVHDGEASVHCILKSCKHLCCQCISGTLLSLQGRKLVYFMQSSLTPKISHGHIVLGHEWTIVMFLLQRLPLSPPPVAPRGLA